jgi:hypothetical protein
MVLSNTLTQSLQPILGKYSITHCLASLKVSCQCHPYRCRVEAAISAGTLHQLASQLRQELAALAAKDYSGNALLQTKKQSLIIDLMHSCNVVEGLLAPEASGAGAAGFVERPTNPKDWAWLRQLRYYADVVSQGAVQYLWAVFGTSALLLC